jgi:predicted dehydrogenase
VEELCAHPRIDYVDLCTFPSIRLQILKLCARSSKHLLVQKPMAVDLVTAREMVSIAAGAGVQLGVVSQHRFDDSTLFLKRAIQEGRLGRILQADAYVKWHRSAEYYSRPIKGTWSVEGGGALITQAIHQIDLLLYLVGPVTRVYGEWQLGTLHHIESEDVVNAVLRYADGATGVIQASTAFWPGYPERIEIHGTKGSAVVTGDKLATWDVKDDEGEPAPIATLGASGASDPMAISVVPFERQFLDFAEACVQRRPPLCSGEDGYRALECVMSIYDSCRSEQPILIAR